MFGIIRVRVLPQYANDWGITSAHVGRYYYDRTYVSQAEHPFSVLKHPLTTFVTTVSQ